MAERSAGILMYRRPGPAIEVLLVHPGGPYWARKDDGVWSIPKGRYGEDEDALAAARREFEEETGCVPAGRFVALGSFKQPSGKLISAWAVEGDLDLAQFRSNTFTMQWPPRSGRMQEFPEADKAAWMGPEQAARKILKGQLPILAALYQHLAAPPVP
jgi:predicted NUDIX family NTP pyrophosphohydrolase